MVEDALRTPGLAEVQGSYTRWAPAYVDLFGSAAKASEADRSLIGGWAVSVAGAVLDAGCGPGHWSAYLHEQGVDVRGIDATEAFVQHARRSHRGIDFEVGDLRTLTLPDRSLGGVLAWFSLIHTDPGEVPAVLQAFARALRPGGSLLLGFFSGGTLSPFDHRVVTAWAWPVRRMCDLVEGAGLRIVDRHEEPAPNGRVVAHVVARRPEPELP